MNETNRTGRERLYQLVEDWKEAADDLGGAAGTAVRGCSSELERELDRHHNTDRELGGGDDG